MSVHLHYNESHPSPCSCRLGDHSACRRSDTPYAPCAELEYREERVGLDCRAGTDPSEAVPVDLYRMRPSVGSAEGVRTRLIIRLRATIKKAVLEKEKWFQTGASALTRYANPQGGVARHFDIAIGTQSHRFCVFTATEEAATPPPTTEIPEIVRRATMRHGAPPGRCRWRLCGGNERVPPFGSRGQARRRSA